MSHLTRRLVEGLAEAYKREHPEEDTDPQPTPEETEAAAVAAFGRALYGISPPTAPQEEPRRD